tara:strand:- start:473 stop:1081 length:609 start_codon:yes stop_codon:yes gene_type:complete
MIGILDYGAGNLHSVNNALTFLGAKSKIVSEKNDIYSFDSLIIPGVGSFQNAMKKFNEKEIVQPILDFAYSGKPILGICLGMQILATNGYEPVKTQGLNLIPGEVRPIRTSLKLPHVGWNGISINKECSLLKGVKLNADFYFVHSYHYIPDDNDSIVTFTDYGKSFVSCINSENIYGIQFHPEKSQKQGLRILKNYIELINA